MKNDLKKKLALLLVLSALISLTSCGDAETENEADAGQTPSGETTEQEVVVEEEELPYDNLPELNFNGETVSIFFPEGANNRKRDAAGDVEGDVVDVAVYNRNLAVNERLNVELSFEESTPYPNELGFPTEVHKLVMAGDTSHDLVLEETSFCFQYMLQGDFREISHLPYLELDQPWWYTAFMEKGMIQADRKYYLTGAAALGCFERAGCTHFNKDLFSMSFGDVEQLYTLVEDHKWTYDAVNSYSQQIFQDLDNNGSASSGDIVGVAYHAGAINNYLSSSNGLSYVRMDEEGFPRLDLYNDDTNRWVEILYHMLKEDNIATPIGESDFGGGKNLFQFGLLQELSGGMRDLELAHGVLPCPLIDEGNEYATTAGTVNGNSFAMPVTTPDSKDEICGAVMEALCSESYRNVLPVWLETALKSKYSDTQRDADMIDIIYSSIDNNLPLMADKQMNGETGSFFWNYLETQKKTPGEFASYYATKQQMLEKQWDNMIKRYLKLDD